MACMAILPRPDDVAGFAAAMAHCIEDRDFAATCGRNALSLSKSGMDWAAIGQPYRDGIRGSDCFAG